jgi:excisionase family DNA binding protein
MTEKLLTVKEVAEILDLKRARIYELTRQNKFPFTVKIGERQYRYNEAGLNEWIKNGGNREQNSENENV